MSNRSINFQNLGGFPGTQYTLDFMQQSYRDAINGLAKLAGANVIVTGVENVNGTVTDGWIVYGGELLPFKGGLLQSTFIITETTEDRKFSDDVVRQVYKTRFARFGSGGIAFTSLTRLKTVDNLQSLLQELSNKLSELDNAVRPSIVPAGVIMAWPYDVALIPEGWALCDGLEGRPHVQGRFLLGAGQATGLHPDDLNPVYAVGDIGGENLHKLSIPEMPSHDHDSDFPGADSFSGNRFNAAKTNDPTKRKTSKAGGDLPHENRPPYYVVNWIIKL